MKLDRIGELIKKDFEDNGQSTTMNINYLIGILNGLKDNGEKTVNLAIINNKPLMINNIILIADMDVN